MSVKNIVRSSISPLGVIGIVPRAKIVYVGSSTYTSELVGTDGSTVTTTLRTDILNKSGDRYLKGWTKTSGSTTVNYNRGASVTLTDGQTLTIYPVYYADAKIVYSGANRKVTNGTTYTQTVHATSTGSYATTTNNTYFRKLYNLAPFAKWNTNTSGTGTNYNGGASITLSEGQTLTLYPVYTATSKTVNLGETSDRTVSSTTSSAGSYSKAYTFTISNYLSGYTAGDSYTYQLYGKIYEGNSGTYRNYYKIGSGSEVTLVSGTGTAGNTTTNTKNLTGSTASISLTFHFTVSKGSAAKSGKFQAYVKTITVS